MEKVRREMAVIGIRCQCSIKSQKSEDIHRHYKMKVTFFYFFLFNAFVRFIFTIYYI